MAELNHLTIPPSSGRGLTLLSGEVLEVLTPQGSQVSDFFCVTHDLQNYFSALRTMDYAESTRITKGHLLYSQNSEVLGEILEDSCGVHDCLMPPCSLRMYQIVEEDPELQHPSCHENIVKALRPFGVDEKMLHCSFNIFMNVPVIGQSRLTIRPPEARAGDFIRILAKKDLYVALTACPHPGTNGLLRTEIQYRILK